MMQRCRHGKDPRPLLPLRPLLMTITGVVCSRRALWGLAHPAKLAAVKRGGWLYRQFGALGVATGLLELGLAMLVGGTVRTRRAWWRWGMA